MKLWQELTLILQWLAEPMGCDELQLHQQDIAASPPH